MDGTVAFGSAYHNWGITIPYMKKSGVSMTDIFQYCNDEKQKELAQAAPVTKFSSIWLLQNCQAQLKRNHTVFQTSGLAILNLQSEGHDGLRS